MSNLITKISVIFMIVLAVVSCSGSGGSSSGGSNVNPADSATVLIGNISVIPLNANDLTESYLVVSNNGDSELDYTGYQIDGANASSLSSKLSIHQKVKLSAISPSIDVSNCSKIMPHSNCKVGFTPPSTSGTLLFTMLFKDKNSKTYQANQVLSYSDIINPINGFTVSSTNLNVVKKPSSNMIVSVPFLLDHDYNAKPTVVSSIGSYPVDVACPKNSYTQGSLCTALVNVSNSGTSQFTQTKLTISGTTGTTLHSTNVNLNVIQNNIANLVTSATNVVINPANGQAGNAQLIYLLNTGTATATGLQITSQATTPNAVVTAGNVPSCTSVTSLATGASCSFRVNVDSGANNSSGQTYVTVGYNNSVNQQNINFNVIYVGSVPAVAMTLSTALGSLTNVPQGQTSTLVINVKNTSTTNTTLSNISFSNVTSQKSTITYDPGGSCLTNGTQSLVQGQSCTLILSYTPSANNDSGNVVIDENASYTLNGQTASYTAATLSVPYSSIASVAFLWVNPSAVTMSIRADGTSTQVQTFTVTNSGGVSTTPSSASFSAAIAGLTKTSDNCTGNAIASNSTCTIQVTYGPRSTNVSSTSTNLNIVYPQGASTATAFSVITVDASVAALVQITGFTLTGTTLSGTGASGNPYTFINKPNNQLTFVTTYTNNGTATATDFNVNTYNLPLGYVVNPASTCPYNTATPTTNLTTGTSCTISTSLIDPAGYINPYNIADSTSFNYSFLGYSYTDSSTGVNVSVSPTTCVGGGCTAGYTSGVSYVTTRTFASVSNNTPTTTGGEGVSRNTTITFTSAAVSGVTFPAGGLVITVNIPTSGGGQIATASSPAAGGNNGCSISTVTGTCTVTITSPIGTPNGPYNYNYTVKISGDTTGIIKNLSFSLTN